MVTVRCRGCSRQFFSLEDFRKHVKDCPKDNPLDYIDETEEFRSFGTEPLPKKDKAGTLEDFIT